MKLFRVLIILLSCAYPLSCFTQEKNNKLVKLFDEGKYKETIKIAGKEIERNKTEGINYLYRGLAFLKLKKFQESYNDFSEAIKNDPSFAEAYFYRSVILALGNQNTEAINDLNMSIKYTKVDSIKQLSYAYRAGSKLQMYNIEGAIYDCQESLKIDSLNKNSKLAFSTLATAYGYQKKYDLSIPILERLYRQDSTEVTFISNLGYEYALVENYEKAIVFLDKALKIEPNAAYVLSNKGYTFTKIGKYDEALSLINKSISIDPTNSYAYKNLGLVYLAKKESRNACEAFRLAILKGFTDMYGSEVADLQREYCK